jgi:ATP-dependent RNA helicase RhlE
MPFRALGLRSEIQKSIDELGYKEPTPIQTRAVPVILKGKDVIGIAQTGTGKTAAFVWPILERIMATRPDPAPERPAPRALVLVPTRELAVQVYDNLVAYAKYLPVRAIAIYGGVSEFPQLQALKKGADVLVATPGRLLDFMSTLSVPVKEIDFLVLDESDRMLDMGFIPDVRRIIGSMPARRQTLFFSATFPPAVEKLSKEFLSNPQMVEIGRRSSPTETVAQYVFEVPRPRKAALLAHILQQYDLECVLVFTRTKHGADKLSKELAKGGVMVTALHSNRTQGQRLAALKGFKQGHYQVLVATDIAARGIDVDGISHVVNYDFPNHPEDYVHRIGRTGRAQAIGDALSFVSPEEMPALRALEKFIGRGIPRRVVAGFDLRASSSPAPHGDRGGRPSHGGGRPGRDGGRPGGHGASGGRPGGPGASGGRGEPRAGGSGGGSRRGPGGDERRPPRSDGGGRPARGGGSRENQSPASALVAAPPEVARNEAARGEVARGEAVRSEAPRVIPPGESAPLVPAGGDTWGRTPKPGRRRR